MADTITKKLYPVDAVQGIADAIRGKNGATDKYKITDMAAAITAISGGGGTGTTYKVTVMAAGDNQHYTITCDDKAQTDTFSAEKGSIIKCSLTADDGYNKGVLTISGGKAFADGSYSLTSDMTISASAAVKPSDMTLLGSGNTKFDADGTLSKYTAIRVAKIIPNNTTVHFKTYIFCPTGAVIDYMAISDAKNGRLWTATNAYTTKYTTEKVSNGNNYVMEWDELVNVAKADMNSDDDSAKNLMAYYCCSESAVKMASGTTKFDFTTCILTAEVYKLPTK